MVNERIKLAREAARISPAELARRMKVKPSSVSLWESGKNVPTVRNMMQLAVVLQVRFEWLATGRGEMKYTHGAQEDLRPYGLGDVPDDQRDLLKEYLRLKVPARQALLAFLKKLGK